VVDPKRNLAGLDVPGCGGTGNEAERAAKCQENELVLRMPNHMLPGYTSPSFLHCATMELPHLNCPGGAWTAASALIDLNGPAAVGRNIGVLLSERFV